MAQCTGKYNTAGQHTQGPGLHCWMILRVLWCTGPKATTPCTRRHTRHCRQGAAGLGACAHNVQHTTTADSLSVLGQCRTLWQVYSRVLPTDSQPNGPDRATGTSDTRDRHPPRGGGGGGRGAPTAFALLGDSAAAGVTRPSRAINQTIGSLGQCCGRRRATGSHRPRLQWATAKATTGLGGGTN